jgi:hypothetical protein
MSLTFSLRRLLVGVTVLCVLCALVANFPSVSLAVALAIPFMLPTIVVCAGLSWLSSRPLETCVFAVTGAFVGYVLTPGVRAEWSDLYSFDVRTPPWLPAAGAFVLGIGWVIFFPRWKAPRG